MPKQIEVPGQGIVEFPDSMDDTQIVAAIQKMSPANPEVNERKFLNFLSKAEGAGYNTIVGGSTFDDLSRHPRVVGVRTRSGPSTAAGAYQITAQTYDDFAPKLGITDFSQESQDKIAREIIRRQGALEDVQAGNWESAINKLGGRWASLPSSKSGQSKRTMEWALAQLNAPDEGAPAKPAFQPFPKAPKKVTQDDLVKDESWLRASAMMYSLFEKKNFEGTQEELASYGKKGMANFNFDMVSMADIANKVVTQGSQEDKEAFLYMLDTYDNVEMSWEGAGRAAVATITDPSTWIGVGTLGVAAGGKLLGRKAAVEAARETVVKSLARTGMVAGIDAGISGAVTETTRQGVEKSAGRRDEFDLTKIGVATGVSAVAGAALGTAADVAAKKLIALVRGEAKGIAGNAPGAAPAPSSGAAKGKGASDAEKRADALINPEQPAVAKQADDLGNTLTPAEIAEATARQQKGRLPEDDLMPEVNLKKAPKVEVDNYNTGLRTTPTTMAELTSAAKPVADQLRVLSKEDLTGALELIRWNEQGFETSRVLARGVQMYADELRITKAELLKEINAKGTPTDKVAELSAKVAALDERLTPLGLADDAFGSMAGSILRQRQEGLPGVSGVTVESIMKDLKLSKTEAEQVWASMVTKAEQETEAQKIANAYNAKADEAIAKGDLTGAAMLALEKNREIAALTEQVAPKSASLIQKFNELAISNVFTPKTILVNLIPSGLKTLVIPGMKAALTNPFDRAVRIETMAAYSAMASAFKPALSAAKAAFKYEQSFITRDGTRLMEGELAITGKFGGTIRFLPRILNASDEFLSRINYDSFVAGQAAAEAVFAAEARGLKGKAFDTFVKDATKKALSDSMGLGSADELVQPIINKGVNLGLRGDKLFAWVRKEASKNPSALRKGTSEEAVNYVRDVLYKRKFSGDGTASSLALKYEELMNQVPTLKVIFGQLFFRTPIRVFEEGIRMTPGIQILAPGFLKDLSGQNGTLRQVRAQGESMASLGIAGAALTLYGQGRITGDGAYNDWKQKRNREDGPTPPPYSIIMSDGSTWSYRNFDPLATPLKIMINGFERMDRLRLREAQGELVDKSLHMQAAAYLTVGASALAQAIRDASLVAGAEGTIKFLESLADPEGKADATLKLFGEKVGLLVPNTLHKIAKDNDPSIKDPATFWQMLEEKLARPLGKDDIKTSHAYDPLGNIRKLADTGSLWNVFSTASVEERSRGMSEEEQFVMTEMDRLARVTNATFKAPVKHKELGELDLRTVMASDGSRTLYDVWQQNYRALDPVNVLYPIMSSQLSDGTFKVIGEKAEEAQSAINKLQDAAFYQMMVDEQKVIDKYVNQIVYEQKAKAGFFDMPKR